MERSQARLGQGSGVAAVQANPGCSNFICTWPGGCSEEPQVWAVPAPAFPPLPRDSSAAGHAHTPGSLPTEQEVHKEGASPADAPPESKSWLKGVPTTDPGGRARTQTLDNAWEGESRTLRRPSKGLRCPSIQRGRSRTTTHLL